MYDQDIFHITTLQHEKTLLKTQDSHITDAMYAAIDEAMNNNNPVGALVGHYDERLSITAASHGFWEQLGFLDEDFQSGKEGSLLNLIYQPDVHMFSLDKFINTHGKFEFRMRTKDGSRLYITSFKRDTIDENGIPLWILAVRVNPAGQNLSLVNDVMQTGMWTFEYNEKGQLDSVTWSDRFRQMLGYQDTSDFPNKLDSWFRLVHPSDREQVLAFMDMVPTDPTGQTKYNMEYRVKMPDGTYQWFSINAEVVRRASGIARRIVGIFFNIDVRKNTTVLAEKYSALDKLIQGMTKVVNRFAVCDLEHDSYEWHKMDDNKLISYKGAYSSLQKTVCTKFKLLSESEDIGYIFSPDNIRGHLTSESDIYRFEYCTLDEKYFKNMSIVPLEWKNTQLTKVLFIVMNVTQAKEREIQSRQALREAYMAANRANQAKIEFLSNISHDIRTPMNAIVGMTALAAAHVDQKDRVLDSLGKITTSSRHLLGLINEVLDMSRIESGKVMLSEEKFYLPDLVDNLITMVKPDIIAHKHEFTVNIADIRHEDIIGDSLRIQQIFTNMMSNAIKFTPDGGKITFTLREKPMQRKKIGCFEFVFEDNGIGMSEQVQKIIFEPFTRADDKRTSQIQGTGLGLAITNNIVSMMDGHIQVKSAPDQGSRFTITLFMKLQETDIDTTEELINLPVLMADSDQGCCINTTAILNDLGMKSEWVSTGSATIEQVLKRHHANDDFFAVLLSWQLPDMSGIETARQIRRHIGNDIPIIVLSSYDHSEFEEEARKADINYFITKPLFRSRLISLFRKLTGNEIEKEETPLITPLLRTDFSGKHVLLVEDNSLNMEIAVELIGMTGVTIETAENGQIAVDMISNAPEHYYDLVFMDIQMPVLDGYQATARIRALDKSYTDHLPIVAMTANAFAEDMIAAHKAGMDEYIAKPIDMEKVAAMMKKFL